MFEEREQNQDGTTSCGVFIPLPYNIAREFEKKPEDDSVPHFTLLFAGDLSPCEYRRFVKVIRKACRNIAPFPLDVSHYSEFENQDKKTISHMRPGCLGSSILARVHGILRRAADAAGIKVAHHYGKVPGGNSVPYEIKFKPHATLKYQDKLEGPYRGPKPTGSWNVTELECWGHERICAALGRQKYDQQLGLTRTPVLSRYPRAVREDKLPGGLADRSKPSDFDQKELARGIKVELEHTKDTSLAQEIAMDHLKEDPRYYTKLRGIHKESNAWMEAALDAEELKRKAEALRKRVADISGMTTQTRLNPKEDTVRRAREAMKAAEGGDKPATDKIKIGKMIRAPLLLVKVLRRTPLVKVKPKVKIGKQDLRAKPKIIIKREKLGESGWGPSNSGIGPHGTLEYLRILQKEDRKARLRKKRGGK